MATAAEGSQFASESAEGGRAKSLEEGIEEITLDDDDAATFGRVPVRHMPRIVMPTALSANARYDVFVKEFKIAECRPSLVLNKVHAYIEERLMNRKWLAVWRGAYDTLTRRSVDVLVEVDDVCGDQAHVSVFDPVMGSGTESPLEAFESQLERRDHTVDLIELYPVSMKERNCDEKELDEQELEIREIASVIDNIRFFFGHIHRDWDEEDEGEQAFDTYLRARLQLYYDIVTGCVPAALVARYNRTMAKYIIRRKELLDYQSQIQNDNKATNSEAIECWRKYYEVLMLSGLLQIWETLQLRAEGPCFPRVLRGSKGKRNDGSTVTHLVTETLTPSMLRDFADDTAIFQHQSPQSALQQCYEGDTILLYPGTYSGEGFHELTESVTIKGVGKREEVIVEAISYDDLFLNVSSATITLKNITFVQSDNTEGALRVQSGHAIVTDCEFKCDGTGIAVREGAKLTMKNCRIAGTKGAAVELLPGCTAVLEGNEIIHIKEVNDDPDLEDDLDFDRFTGKGAVHLHVVDPPNVIMQDNKIRCEGGRGVTVGRKVYSSKAFLLQNDQSQAGDADGGDAPIQTKGDDALLKLGIDLKNNNIEEIPVGDGTSAMPH